MFPSRLNGQLGGGPSNHHKSYASSFQEQDALFNSYEHLLDAPQPEEALTRLRKIASLVKPIMRKRAWQVKTLTEFLPEDERLLGLNINRTFKICVRLRYSHAPQTFLPIEQCVDTLLHELSHIVHGPHDANFHALWDELRGEHETLLFRGYTGAGFLSGGQKLGGGQLPPTNELRRLARASAEKRNVLQKGSGRRVGGKQLPTGVDVRKVLADAADRRATVDRGCASNTAQATNLADQKDRQTFKTKAEEDDANNRAISEALFDLLEEEEAQKMRGTFSTPPPSGGLVWSSEGGLQAGSGSTHSQIPASEEDQMKWALQESLKENIPQSRKRPISVESGSTSSQPTRRKPLRPPSSESVVRKDTPVIDLTENDDADEVTAPKPSHLSSTDNASSWVCGVCTCINPQKYLVCDACGTECPASHPKPAAKSATTLNRSNGGYSLNEGRKEKAKSPGWYCRECGNFMEHQWWTCSECGLMKDRS